MRTLVCFATFFLLSRAYAATVVVNGLTLQIADNTGQITQMSHPTLGTFLLNSAQANGLLVTWQTCDTQGDVNSICLQAAIQNTSTSAIGPVYFPDLQGIQDFKTIMPLDSAQETDLRMAFGVINPFLAGNFSQDYSGGIYEMYGLRWIDLGNFHRGISIFQKQWGVEQSSLNSGAPTARPSLHVEHGPSGMRLAWKNNITLNPGQKWNSDQFWFTPHSGGWANGISPYRNYVQQMLQSPTWGRRTPIPPHVRDGLGFQTIWMVEGLEPAKNPQPAFRFTDLLSAAQDAFRNGINEIVLWGSLQYDQLPIPVDPRVGTQQQFLDGVQAAKKIGVNVAPFFNEDSGCTTTAISPAATITNWFFSFTTWLYHSELIPAMQLPVLTPLAQMASSPQTFCNHYPNPAALPALTTLTSAGANSFSMDVFTDDGTTGLETSVQAVRSNAFHSDPESTFSGEPDITNMERAAMVLDYTWSWHDYFEAGPYLSTVRYPRPNVNVSQSPRVVWMAFIDGLYLNAMPSVPNKANGTALISSVPAVATALQQAAVLRKQFLPYFTQGNFLGESVLSEPAAKFTRQSTNSYTGGATVEMGAFTYPAMFIKGYQLGNQLLIFVLNNGTSATTAQFKTNLNMWLPNSSTFQIRSYDSTGKLYANGGPCSLTPSDATWIGSTKSLAPLEVTVCEIIGSP